MSTDQPAADTPLANVVDIPTDTRVHRGSTAIISVAETDAVQVCVQVRDGVDAASIAAAIADAQRLALDEHAAHQGGEHPCSE